MLTFCFCYRPSSPGVLSMSAPAPAPFPFCRLLRLNPVLVVTIFSATLRDFHRVETMEMRRARLWVSVITYHTVFTFVQSKNNNKTIPSRSPQHLIKQLLLRSATFADLRLTAFNKPPPPPGNGGNIRFKKKIQTYYSY